MAYDERLSQRVQQVLARKRGIEQKKMFGGNAFLLKGRLLVGVRKDTLLVRLSPETGEAALDEPHVREFVMRGRGSIKGWILVGVDGLTQDSELSRWIERAIKFVSSLPEKPKG